MKTRKTDKIAELAEMEKSMVAELTEALAMKQDEHNKRFQIVWLAVELNVDRHTLQKRLSAAGHETSK
jgi:hypothetical protein